MAGHVNMTVSMDLAFYQRLMASRKATDPSADAAYGRTLFAEALALREAAAAKAALPPPRPVLPDMSKREAWERKAIRLKVKEDQAAWDAKWGKAAQS